METQVQPQGSPCKIFASLNYFLYTIHYYVSTARYYQYLQKRHHTTNQKTSPFFGTYHVTYIRTYTTTITQNSVTDNNISHACKTIYTYREREQERERQTETEIQNFPGQTKEKPYKPKVNVADLSRLSWFLQNASDYCCSNLLSV